MSASDREWLDGLIARAREADGAPPFSDGSLVALASGDRRLIRRADSAAIISPTEAEFVVDPLHRERGLGRDLLHELLVATPGDLLLWSHGDHPAARALARTFGLEPVRRLLQLRATITEHIGCPLTTTVSIGSAQGDWQDAWVTLNARAFAAHPEQGRMTRADLDQLMTESWFSTDDVILAYDLVGELVAYCWLKVEDGSGEIYVIGVAPEWQGKGLGRIVLEAGIAHLARQGIQDVHLYVEGDNAPALALYDSLGFREHSVDIQYRWRSTPDD